MQSRVYVWAKRGGNNRCMCFCLWVCVLMGHGLMKSLLGVQSVSKVSEVSKSKKNDLNEGKCQENVR